MVWLSLLRCTGRHSSILCMVPLASSTGPALAEGRSKLHEQLAAPYAGKQWLVRPMSPLSCCQSMKVFDIREIMYTRLQWLFPDR